MTKQPVEGCGFTFSGWGRVGETDENGIYNDPGHNFTGELTSGGRGLHLWHPDYDNKGVNNYRPGKDGISRIYLSKGGNCRVDIKVTLEVRGKMSYCPCRVRIMNPNRQEIRRIERTEDSQFNFSGLKAGEYLVEAYFWDSYPTVYKKIKLAENEHKKIEINAVTDQAARIRVIGKLLDKRTGKGIGGAKVHFVGAPNDDAITNDEGSFSTVADRARFHQCLIYFDKQPPTPIRISNNIDEKLAKNLAIHFDPMNSNSKERMTDKDGDGIFCDELNCSICKQNTKTSLQE